MLKCRPKLLLVDDHPENLAVLKGVIAASIPLALLETVGSAQVALEWIASHKVDGIISDMQMPEMDGLELCWRLRSAAVNVGVPIILITSHISTSKLRAEAFSAGAFDFISRPIDNVELIARIHSMLRAKGTDDRLRTTNADLTQRVVRQGVSLREYRKAVESSPDLVATISTDYRYLMVNETFVRYHRLDNERIIGRSVSDFLPKDTFNNLVRPRLEACLRGETVEFETTRTFLELGVRHLLIRYCPLKRKGGLIEGVVAIIRDITEHKHLEEQLQQGQKMEALGTLIGGITHDFNNILAAICGYTQVSQLQVEKGTKLDHNLQQIGVAANRATELVRQILTFSRKTKEELEPLQIHLIIKDALKFLQASIPNSVELHQHIAVDPGLILGNSMQIYRILINLCSNAYQAMQEQGGVIDVRLESVVVDPGLASTHPDLHAGDYILLEVRDNGPGMDKITAARAFEPFFTSKKIGEGTGMGLPVVYGIVKSCGGAVLLDSSPGQGATFAVYFPRHQAELKIQQQEPVELPHGTEHILFVDDESTLVYLGQELLGSLGYRVTGSADIRGALELFRDHPEDFDAVILDYAMPGLSGVKFAQEIMAIRSDIPVIIYTGYLGSLDEKKVKSIGVKALLPKPLGRAEFACELRRVLDEMPREVASINLFVQQNSLHSQLN